jgi:hypothetical protein
MTQRLERLSHEIMAVIAREIVPGTLSSKRMSCRTVERF